MKILAYLAIVDSADFTFLLNQTGLTRGNLSPNLRRLEEAGYVTIQKTFVDRVPRTLIRLTVEGRDAIQRYNRTMQRVLDELLSSK
jgi:DNA-binding MarR family transcriptional regulator